MPPLWDATLTVKCVDVSRLVRDGFFWSADNIATEESYVQAASARWAARGHSFLRTWILAEKPTRDLCGHHKWVACLEVAAPAFETLAGFRLRNLTTANVRKANAWGVQWNPVYNYDFDAPAQNYNFIYDDKPLRGWWPWPRGEHGLFQRLFGPLAGTAANARPRRNSAADSSSGEVVLGCILSLAVVYLIGRLGAAIKDLST